MKHKIKYTIFYILLFVLAASGCKDKTEVEPNKWALPPITSEGANTLGCLINGEPFVADREVIPYMGSQWNMHAYYIDSFSFELSGEDIDRNRNELNIGIQTTRALSIIEGKTYEIHDGSKFPSTKYIDYGYFGGRPYRVIEEEPQWVKVHSFKDNEYVSGTFQFTGVSSEGDTVRITDGRFDIALD